MLGVQQHQSYVVCHDTCEVALHDMMTTIAGGVHSMNSTLLVKSTLGYEMPFFALQCTVDPSTVGAARSMFRDVGLLV